MGFSVRLFSHNGSILSHTLLLFQQFWSAFFPNDVFQLQKYGFANICRKPEPYKTPRMERFAKIVNGF